MKATLKLKLGIGNLPKDLVSLTGINVGGKELEMWNKDRSNSDQLKWVTTDTQLFLSVEFMDHKTCKITYTK